MELARYFELAHRAYSKLQSEFVPTEHQLSMRRWRADDKDRQLRLTYDLWPESIVLDLGGYEGQWTSDLFSRYLCEIAVFEPVSRYAEQIRQRFARNHRISVYPYGLGAATRTEQIHVADDGSSLFGKSGQIEEIKIVDVKEWIETRNIRQIDLMKVNIEGGEYELLDRLIGTGLIECVLNLQVQFHPISPTSVDDVQRLRTEMRKTHQPTYQYDFIWENWARQSG